MRRCFLLGVPLAVGVGVWLAWGGGAGLAPQAAQVQEEPSASGGDHVEGAVVPQAAEPAVATPAERVEADPAETPVQVMSWTERARQRLASTSTLGDVGCLALVSGIRRVLDTVEGANAFVVSMPSVDELQKNLSINPSGRALSPDEASQLQELIDDYGRRISDCRRDCYLASNIGMMDAIAARDFAEKPNGSDPEGIERQTIRKASELFAANPGDQNFAEVPGANFGHNRLIFMTREKYPEYFTAVDAEKMTRAEYEVAIRTFFLGIGRR